MEGTAEAREAVPLSAHGLGVGIPVVGTIDIDGSTNTAISIKADKRLGLRRGRRCSDHCTWSYMSNNSQRSGNSTSGVDDHCYGSSHSSSCSLSDNAESNAESNSGVCNANFNGNFNRFPHEAISSSDSDTDITQVKGGRKQRIIFVNNSSTGQTCPPQMGNVNNNANSNTTSETSDSGVNAIVGDECNRFRHDLQPPDEDGSRRSSRVNLSVASETSDFSEWTDYQSDSSSCSPGPFFSDGDECISDMLSGVEDGSSVSSPPGKGKKAQCRLTGSAQRRVSHASVCIYHTPERKSLFCLDCDEPICLQCKADPEHTSHKSTTLGNAATECRNRLKLLHSNLEEERVELSSSLRDQREYRERLTRNRETIFDKLLQRRTYLHELVERWHSKMQVRVDAVFASEQENARRYIEEIEQRIGELREELEYLSFVLTHHQAADVLALSKELLSTRETNNNYNCDQTEEEILKERDEHLNRITQSFSELYFLFNPGSGPRYSDLGDFSIGHMSGSGKGENLVISSGRMKFSFDTRLGEKPSGQYAATGLSLMENGDFLVTDLGLDRVQVFQPNGHHMLCVNTLPGVEPSNAVPLPADSLGGLLIASRSGLRLYSSDGTYGKNLWPNVVQCPNGLHVRKAHSELIVTDHCCDGPYIHIFSMDGEEVVLKNTIVGGTRAPNFHQPWYVTSTADGQIIVSDREEHNIKIFNPLGGLVSEFGSQGAQAGQFFRPAGVCVDRFGHILVADSGNRRVQMFTSEGEFCAILLAEEDNELETPMDLVIDASGQLVVLQANGILATYQYMY